jgi:hypothetical protein
MVDAHNTALPSLAQQAIDNRRKRLLAPNLSVPMPLAFPLNDADVCSANLAIPTVRKKVAPSLPPATSAKFEPEPTWGMEQYEHALRIMPDIGARDGTQSDAFRSMNEDALRTALFWSN